MSIYPPITKCDDCKDQPLLCRMKYHSLERWYYVWSWPGIYWVFKKIHRAFCPNKKGNQRHVWTFWLRNNS
jgi:hypothetical protein